MTQQENQHDVVVIGAGMAGHCAAIEAARRGASVLLLEKTALYGGSTRMCGGAFAFAGTEVQRRNEIPDSAQLLEQDLLEAGKHRNDKALVHVYAERQYETYEWLQAMGLRFDKVSLSGSQSVPRNHSIDPVLVLETLHAQALVAGVAYRAGAHVERLLTEGEGDARRVIGVVLKDGERIGARGGVVIATGGFSRAPDLVERFAPHLREARPMGGHGNTGDGLRMAWALGADLIDLGYVKGTFGAPVAEPAPGKEEVAPRLVSAMYRGAIIVNRAGRRFVNESVSYKTIGDRCLEQPELLGFQVFDQRVMDQSSPLPTVADYKGALDAGLVKQADSLEALAAALGIDAAALRETVDAYNRACDGAEPDAFGRTSLSTGYGKPTRVETGPFYGLACTTGLTSTYCGLHIDVDARVLDVYKRPIEGLYATGEVMGGFHGETYMSGSSLAKGCIFGRLAAQHAVARAAA
ncbi:fumarate reductase flavoprotein subunit [Variovorax sp. PDC80]|uniref:FAD-dependent oxidoreductase n=1 Tax=Variovorax sp. PDC80 TaxID=1882827 RepID=UPI0008E1F34C|nr:FAD-dependent oxidoreductase [Variovorax sp. PDC80]SFP29931.1 fumarate reductase flavoprotein subunit [Variovorax sp. PDC80]